MKNSNIVLFFLRLSIASVLLYAGVASILEPFNWIGYLPVQLRTLFPAQTLLMIFSIYELILGVWLLSAWKTFYAALLASLTFLAIIGANITQLDILFRDLAIFFSSLALAVAYYPKEL